MKINILSNKIPWFGKYSGYECLPYYYSNKKDLLINYPNPTVMNKIIGKIYQRTTGYYYVSPEEVVSEIKFIKGVAKSAVSHILYLDGHTHLVSKIKRSDKNLIGTIHRPFSYWNEDELNRLSDVDSVIILYKEEVKKFGKYISPNNIHVIKHGVNINFFKPGDIEIINKNKILFVGHYLRNFPMFSKVYKYLCNEFDSLEYHIIIPEPFRKYHPELEELKANKNVFFYEKLSDEELLRQYQESFVLLVPMLDSGVNTAIIQALATGLPVLTTDVGGIRSYGGNDIFPVTADNDYLSMINLFKKYYSEPGFRQDISAKQRNYALNHLDWHTVAKEHTDLYQSIRCCSK